MPLYRLYMASESALCYTEVSSIGGSINVSVPVDYKSDGYQTSYAPINVFPTPVGRWG